MTSDAALERTKLSYRELAKRHARAASDCAFKAANSRSGSTEAADLTDMAQVHALVSLACSSVAPPIRRERCSVGHVRTVDLGAPFGEHADQALAIAEDGGR